MSVKAVFTLMMYQQQGTWRLVMVQEKSGKWGPPGGSVTDRPGQSYEKVEREEWLEETHIPMVQHFVGPQLDGACSPKYKDQGIVRYTIRIPTDPTEITRFRTLPPTVNTHPDWNDI